MRGLRIVSWALGVLCGCSTATPVDGSEETESLSEDVVLKPVDAGPLVLLVSLDTTRADALSCYSDVSSWGLDLESDERPLPRTPALDELAADGLRFRWALAHAPTTLASHASVFSGRDSRGHGVYRNGVPLDSNGPLLTEEMVKQGFETIAVVGASVLKAETGLNRGFDVYDDSVQMRVRARTEDSGEEVNRRVWKALDERMDPTRPLFLFVHYFDAHSPWDSASPERIQPFLQTDYQGIVQDGSSATIGVLTDFARQRRLGSADRIQARGRYLAEVAQVDHAAGQLFSGLETRGYMDESLVVVFGDHGEILEEIPDRAYGHGRDVDLGAIHVPLIFRARGWMRDVLPDWKTVDTPMSLMDLSATILDIWGAEDQFGEGVSAFRSTKSTAEPARVHFAEATKPHFETDEWPGALLERAVVKNGALFTEAAWLDEEGALFHLAPGQPAMNDANRALELAEELSDWSASHPLIVPPLRDAATQQELQALGYLE